jgi:hypothetical protein
VTLSAKIADVAMAILFLYERLWRDNLSGSEIPYYSISLSVNILLTLMIIGRLVLHNRNIRKAIGASSGHGGLYTAIVTMLVESASLYAVVFLPSLVPLAVNSYVGLIFAIAGEVQVCAVFSFP